MNFEKMFRRKIIKAKLVFPQFRKENEILNSFEKIVRLRFAREARIPQFTI